MPSRDRRPTKHPADHGQLELGKLPEEKSDLGYQAAKNTTNKAAELCITLLALYLVLEVFDIPNGCAPEFQAQCLTDYLNAYVAHDTHTSLTTSNVNCCALELPHLTMPRGGVADPQIVLADCGGLRKLCDESFLAPASEGLREPSPLPSFVRVNQSFGALISLCDCVVADQPVQCEFTASRTVFLLLGIFAIFLFEVSKDSFLAVRLIVFGYSFLYFILCLLIYNRESCDSEEFADKQEIVVFLCVVSIIVMFMALVIELLAVNGKVDLILQKTVSPESQLSHALMSISTKFKKHDSDSSEEHSQGDDLTPRHQKKRRRHYRSEYTVGEMKHHQSRQRDSRTPVSLPDSPPHEALTSV